MSKGITRKSDISTGHDSCPPVPWSSSVAASVFANGKSFGIIGTQGSNHGCRNHSPHPPTIVSGSGTVFATSKGVARCSDSCNCGDKVKQVSGDVFSA